MGTVVDLGPGRSPGTQTLGDAVPADHDDHEKGGGDESHTEGDLSRRLIRLLLPCRDGDHNDNHHEPGHDDEKFGRERDTVTGRNLHEADLASTVVTAGLVPGLFKHGLSGPCLKLSVWCQRRGPRFVSRFVSDPLGLMVAPPLAH